MKTAFLRSCASFCWRRRSPAAPTGGGKGSRRRRADRRRPLPPRRAGRPRPDRDRAVRQGRCATGPNSRLMPPRSSASSTRLGWTVVPPTAQSEQVALIDLEQGSREAVAALDARRGSAAASRPTDARPEPRPTSSPPCSKSPFAAARTAPSSGKAGPSTRPAPAAPQAARTAAVERLAEALFRDFPGESGRTIRVR